MTLFSCFIIILKNLVSNRSYLPLLHGNLYWFSSMGIIEKNLTYHFLPPFSLVLYYVWLSNFSSKIRFRTKIPGLWVKRLVILRPPLLLVYKQVQVTSDLGQAVYILWTFEGQLVRPWTTLGIYESSSQEKMHIWTQTQTLANNFIEIPQ